MWCRIQDFGRRSGRRRLFRCFVLWLLPLASSHPSFFELSRRSAAAFFRRTSLDVASMERFQASAVPRQGLIAVSKIRRIINDNRTFGGTGCSERCDCAAITAVSFATRESQRLSIRTPDNQGFSAGLSVLILG